MTKRLGEKKEEKGKEQPGKDEENKYLPSNVLIKSKLCDTTVYIGVVKLWRESINFRDLSSFLPPGLC